MSRRNALFLAVAALCTTVLVFEFTALDLRIQDVFYAPADNEWLVSKKSKLPRMVFYHGPKILLIVFGSWLLLSLFVPRRSHMSRFFSWHPRRELIYLLLCLGLFPATINLIKRFSGLHCPSETTRYGGAHAYRKLLSARPSDPKELGHCFPAGHASGGFALLGLWFVARTGRERARALFLALGVGTAMGTYQMLSGSHFLSHTLVTLWLAWIATLALASLLRVPVPDESRETFNSSPFGGHA